MYNRSVVITGAVQGIGRAAVLKFANNGYSIAINYRNPLKESEAKALAEECSKISGREAVAICADVSVSENCKFLIDETVRRFDKIDVVVNNAGIMKYSLLHRMSDEDYRQMVSSNQDSVFFMMKYAGKHMLKKKSGSIVNVASVAGIYGSSALSVYSATKGAVIAMTKSASVEFARKNVRVNAVAPGMVNTPMTNDFTAEEKENMSGNIPIGRFAEPAEIAEAIYWLASDESSYITGHVMEISGGLK